MAEHTEHRFEPELRAFADDIATQCANFVADVSAIAREADGGRAVSLLLLEISRISLTGARLGAQVDFHPTAEYQPDVGPETDVEELRMRLAEILGEVDTYGFVFDPYVPEVVESQLSDDIAAIVTDLENGLRHHRSGDLEEALWWWQFSYVNTWGNLAGAALNALLSVIAHDRLDVDLPGEAEQVAVAGEILSGDDQAAR